MKFPDNNTVGWGTLESSEMKFAYQAGPDPDSHLQVCLKDKDYKAQPCSGFLSRFPVVPKTLVVIGSMILGASLVEIAHRCYAEEGLVTAHNSESLNDNAERSDSYADEGLRRSALVEVAGGSLRLTGNLVESTSDIDPFVVASYVDPPEFGPMRFNNDCFWKKQNAVEQQMIKSYVDKIVKKYGDSAMKQFYQDHAKDELWRSSEHLFQQACTRWVAQSTDATWHSSDIRDRNKAMELYFAEDFTSNVFGWAVGGHKILKGREPLKNMVNGYLEVFPDWRIRIMNTQCTKAVSDPFGLVGFFTAMPDYSTGTMLGPLNFPDGTTIDPSEVVDSPIKGKTATFGLAMTFVALDPVTNRWQYQEEVVVHAHDVQYSLLGKEILDKFYTHSGVGIDENPEQRDLEIFGHFSGLVDSCELPEPYFVSLKEDQT